jgi:peptidoglycan/xylan/chitin deacetylase (PgdA/CDA1 family)
MKKVLVAMVVLLGVAYGGLQLSRSRTCQLFGTIVPRVETERKVVALTFDDGPQDDKVDAILASLGGARATFFIIGGDWTAHREAAAKLVAGGHEIGNHSWSHKRMVFKTPSFIRDEFERTDAAIRAAGHRGPIHVRAPYCKKLVGLPWYFAANGRVHVTWDVEPEGHPDIAAFVLEHVRPGSIVLLHPWYGNEKTRAALPEIVGGLRARGYEFVTVDELLKLRKS